MSTAHWPAPARMPIQPRELVERGVCARHPHPGWWTSSLPLERAAAATVCAHCPVLQPCRTWSLSLPLNDSGIYAGLASRGRQQLRKAVQEPVSAAVADEQIPPAA